MARTLALSKRRSSATAEGADCCRGRPNLRVLWQLRYGPAMLHRRHRSSVSPEPIVDIQPRICGGRPHLRGTRIQVADIALWHERLGLTADQIVIRKPQLTLAAVEAALAYYAEHPEQIPLPLDCADTLLENQHVALLPSATLGSE